MNDMHFLFHLRHVEETWLVHRLQLFCMVIGRNGRIYTIILGIYFTLLCIIGVFAMLHKKD